MGFAEQLTFNMIKPSMMTGKYLTIVRRKLNIKKETKNKVILGCISTRSFTRSLEKVFSFRLVEVLFSRKLFVWTSSSWILGQLVLQWFYILYFCKTFAKLDWSLMKEKKEKRRKVVFLLILWCDTKLRNQKGRHQRATTFIMNK